MPIPFSLTSPLPAEDLRFDSMQHSAGVSALEDTQLFLLSDKPDIAPEKLLGQAVNIKLQMRDGAVRHICGLVTRFGLGRHQGRHFGYLAEVRPWLWFLTRRSDCRIFQDMTVPDIVKKVFSNYGGIAVHEFRLTGSYRTRDYTVQYRETDFNFVARLMEDEGVFWYFEHSEGEHKLIVADSPSALSPAPHAEKLPYYGNAGQASPDVDIVTDWNFAREVRSGKTALRSYNFESPSNSLGVDSAESRSHDLADYELYDYQGDYYNSGDGSQIVAVRLDETQSQHERLSGSTNAYGLANGRLFTLERHPRDDQNAEYFVVQTQINASINSLESGTQTGDYSCRFSAVPATQNYRPPRRTPKPFVQGPQSAVVTGPAGEEIYTDKYGRVKVQFHWDRYGKKNETSSCWMRVSHPWAGKSFGAIHIPRIGQEVIVDFLEGDPDQPLITGRVYNAEQMPPWELPANMTQSGILTRSSKGGAYGNANAIRFEDKKGEEQLWLHAEKDQLTEVEHDEDKWVGNDRRKTIDRDETNHIKRDRTETVDRNEKITVHGWRTEEVDGDETITIHSNRTETVDLNETITIHKNRTERVDLDEKISIGANRREDVELNETIEIGQNRSEFVGANESIDIRGNRSKTVAKNESNQIGKSWSISVGKAKTETIGMASMQSVGLGRMDNVGLGYSLNVGAAMATVVGLLKSTNVGTSYSVTVGTEFSVVCGAASFTMKSDGTITLRGKDVIVQGSGDINATASGNIALKATQIDAN
jgi:type VI secretion system secreted protein VgrG